MIAYLSGRVVARRNQSLVVRSGDFGFEVRVVPQLQLSVQIGQEISLHTRMHVREDDISLFGFVSETELEAFDKICTVPGIGPKIALAAIGTLGAAEIGQAIENANESLLTSVPGIGNKTAKLLLVTLAGKMPGTTVGSVENAQPIVEALIGLGVSNSDAEKLWRRALANLGEVATDEALLRECLKLRRS